ncbi:MAG: mannosyl-3-phosphoglycerate phosphatase [Arcobacter sp.]|nr:MAG: mannosyl-3-phosphoglycerate phosphatase [Arcobacter sp.]
MKTLIFTDLDGTFLNHYDYSFDDSKEALAKIFKKNIPLIFTTSKTKVEVEVLQKKVGIKEPFIVENGAAIFFPNNYKNLDFSFLDKYEDYYILQLGLSYKQILNFYEKYKEEFGMFGFSDMSLQEVAKYTGLSVEEVELSKQRNFTEPFLLKDESILKNLQNLAATYNIKITKGGRFYHLIGEDQDKGRAVKKAKMIFKKVYEKKINSIALGDGENDLAMLENVIVPILIKNHKDEFIECDIKNIQKSTYQGSKGWNEMVLKNV